MKLLKFVIPILFLLLVVLACKKTDEQPPVITLKGNDSIGHILNTTYNDPGASATDEFEGNVSTKIYVDNTVNENLVGEYVITYTVVDEAGNEAAPAHRWVFVYNTAYKYESNYSVIDENIYPETQECNYNIYINTDTLVNKRILFNSFNCDFGQSVYGDIDDSEIVIPFQEIADSITSFTIQGSGYITDSTIILDYKKTDTLTSLWKAYLKKL
jgi:hypothetical protein